MTPKLTRRQAAIIGAYTGFTCGPFDDIHAYAEEVFGEPIFSHAFASDLFAAELQKKAKADFLSIVPDEKTRKGEGDEN